MTLDNVRLSSVLFSGIDGATGEPLYDSLRQREVIVQLLARPAVETERRLLFGIDAQNLAEAGWGVVFAPGTPAAVRDALLPLLDRRREEAGYRFRIYEGAAAPQPGEGAGPWLARHGIGPNPVDPARMPYYLLLIGDPAELPFSFQYGLDYQYAVGRLHFGDAASYGCYAASLLAAEDGIAFRPRKLAFWGPHNEGDLATELSATHLVQPLARQLEGLLSPADRESRWKIETLLGERAKKAELARLLGPEAPALLLTASHGIGRPLGDPARECLQGALLCQDWQPRRGVPRPLDPAEIFSADDVSVSADLLGSIVFLFACFGAGTPERDNFSDLGCRSSCVGDGKPFVARLPQRLLSLPRGALAVIGHVERAWAHSFLWEHLGEQVQAFEGCLHALALGCRAGYALEALSDRFGEIASRLASLLAPGELEEGVSPAELQELWRAHHDARNYVLLGDPAVRLFRPVASGAPEGLAS